MTTTVLLVDDHELIRQGLARAFERTEGLEVIAQAATVSEALAAYAAHRPDVVVTDLQLPDGSGLDVVRAVRLDSDVVGLVLLTMHTADAQVFAAMEAGASAFLGKETRGEEVARVVAHAVAAPRSFVAPGLTGSLLRRGAAAATRLTPREQEILRLVADGLGTGDIAGRLYLGESTLKTHLNRIFRKLGVNNRTQALAAAIRLGLLVEARVPSHK
jgi:DNA-binding NarL/FixJ family response regulator